MTWAETQDIALIHIQPGKPRQNAYVERHNRTVRHEWLDLSILGTIKEVQRIASVWLWTDNNGRPTWATAGSHPQLS